MVKNTKQQSVMASTYSLIVLVICFKYNTTVNENIAIKIKKKKVYFQ